MSEGLHNNYALLIGVGEFGPSYTTAKDVQEIKSVLTKSCGYIDDEDHIQLLQDKKATKESVLKGLHWLKEQVDKNSEATILIYYSGHGGEPKNNNDAYHLILHSNSYLSADEFTKALGEIKAKKFLVVVDSCYAGGMAADKSFTEKSFPVEQLARQLNLDELKNGEGRAVLSSSKKDQKSIFDHKIEMSIYTFHLLEALKGAGSQRGDEVVCVSDLMKYVARTVKSTAKYRYSKEQTPYFDIRGEDFPVALLSSPENKPEQQIYEGLMAGDFCYVLSSHISEKNKISGQIQERLKTNNIPFAIINPTKIDQKRDAESFKDSGLWYFKIAEIFDESFSLNSPAQQWWKEQANNYEKRKHELFNAYIEHKLLTSNKERVVIILDAIEKDRHLFEKLPFKYEFFRIIKSYYKKRGDNNDYGRLTFLMLDTFESLQDEDNVTLGWRINSFEQQPRLIINQDLSKRFKNMNYQDFLQGIWHYTNGDVYAMKGELQERIQELHKIVKNSLENFYQ